MQHSSVKRYFSENIDYWTRECQSAATSPLVAHFKKWVKHHGQKNLKIGEFGGGTGVLLKELAKNFSGSKKLYNLEFVEAYRNRQVLREINFEHDSILKSKFQDNFFDVTIVRDVLHHLIGANLKETRKNQQQAIKELKRATKKGGLVLIEELVTSSKTSSAILFSLSRLNHRLGIKIAKFEINPEAIVAFLTPLELAALIDQNFPNQKTSPELYPWCTETTARIAHLGAKCWKMVLVIRNL